MAIDDDFCAGYRSSAIASCSRPPLDSRRATASSAASRSRDTRVPALPLQPPARSAATMPVSSSRADAAAIHADTITATTIRSVRRATCRRIRRTGGEELRAIDRIELVRAAAELAAHLHGTALREHALDFLTPESHQHLRDALA